MKIKLTPELSYIIGFWRKRRTYEGIGVKSTKEHLEVFTREVLDKGLTTPNRLLSDDEKVWFFHSAYRRFFQDIEKDQLERFRYLNEYAANYLGGTFDSVGGIDEKGIVYIGRANKQDAMLLIRLGFGSRWQKERLVVEKPKAFLAFIKNYVKIFAGHKVFGYLKENGRKKRKWESSGQ